MGNAYCAVAGVCVYVYCLRRSLQFSDTAKEHSELATLATFRLH